MTKDVTKKDAGLPASIADAFGGYTGFENFGASDVEMPYISISQALSDAVADGLAKPGEFYHTGLGESLGQSVELVVLGIEHKIVEWEPDGGGFVARHDSLPENALKNADGFTYSTDDGNDLRDTDYYYVMVADHPELGMAVMTLKSTGLKYSRKWKTKMMAVYSGKKIPMPAQVWKVTTEQNENAKGQKYYSIGKGSRASVEFVGTANESIIPEIKEAFDMYNSLGEVEKASIANKVDSGTHESFPDEDDDF